MSTKLPTSIARTRNGMTVCVVLAVASLLVAVCLCLTASDRLQGLLGNTALLTASVWAISLPLGAILGLALAKLELPGIRWLATILAAWLFVPLYVQAAAWQSAFGYAGWANATSVGAESWFQGMTAAVVIHAAAAVPWVAWLAAISLAVVPRELEEQSLLDARPLHVIRRVSLPHLFGGLAAGALWVAIVCSTEIAVTDLFKVRTFAEEIFTEASLGVLGEATGSLATSDLERGVQILRAFALAGALSLAGLGWRWLAAWSDVVNSHQQAWRWLPRHRWLAATTFFLILGVTVAIPLASLIWMSGIVAEGDAPASGRGWSAISAIRQTVLSPWEFRRELAWSGLIGGLAAFAATVLAIVLAWLCRQRPVVTLLTMLLLVVLMTLPAPLLGIFAIKLLNPPPDSIWSPLHWLYDHTVSAAVGVQALRALPLATALMLTQFASLPENVLQAARSDGAGRWGLLLRIAMPLRWGAIAVTLLVSFAFALGELSATFLVLPPGVTTLSLRIFRLLHYGADESIAAISLALIEWLIATVALGGLWLKASSKHAALIDDHN